MNVTPRQFTFLMMILDSAIKWAFRTMRDSTEEELDELIVNEEKRTADLMSHLSG